MTKGWTLKLVAGALLWGAMGPGFAGIELDNTPNANNVPMAGSVWSKELVAGQVRESVDCRVEVVETFGWWPPLAYGSWKQVKVIYARRSLKADEFVYRCEDPTASQSFSCTSSQAGSVARINGASPITVSLPRGVSLADTCRRMSEAASLTLK